MKNICRRCRWSSVLHGAAFAAMLVLAVLNAADKLPDWVYWLAFSMYVAGMATDYVYRFHLVPARQKVDAALADERPESWRVTDSRTTDGDRRGQ
jgi:predicted aspartyl protease